MRMKVHRSRTLVRVCLALGTALPAGLTLAAEVGGEAEPWQVIVGAGVIGLPEYAGSESTQVRAIPLINVRYGRYFIGSLPGPGAPAGLGAYLYEGESLNVGVAVSRDIVDPRQESDDTRLRGLGDIDATTRAGMFASYRLGWLTLRASAFSDVAGNEQGTMASFDAEVTYRFQRLTLWAGPGLVWSNDDSMRTLFGIDAEQAARSGFEQYAAGSGVSLVRFSLGAQYQLTPRWALASRITAARLQSDAADSPIVQDENQNSYALFVTYRF